MSLGTKVQSSNCERCGTPFDPVVSLDGTARCEICASTDRSPSARSRSGRVLRHWTTNKLVVMGRTTTTSSKTADWGLAEGRKLNLVVSKLKSLVGGNGAR